MHETKNDTGAVCTQCMRNHCFPCFRQALSHIPDPLKGFTLIELVISAGVLFALGSLVVNTFNPLTSLKKGNDVKRKADLLTIDQALEKYYLKNGFYPPSSDSFLITIENKQLQFGSDGFVPYLTLLPNDPLPIARKYVYYSPRTNGNQSFWIYTALESTEKPDCNGVACTYASGAIPPDACSVNGFHAVCNYGLSSTNVSP